MPRLLAVAAALAACAGPTLVLAADAKPADTVRNVCSKCHGPGGSGGSGLFPRLAGQQSAYLERQLKSFRGHDRADDHARSYMWGVARPLNDAQIHGLAVYLSSRPAVKGTPSAAPDLAARGKALFEKGVADRQIPACIDCHGATAGGVEEIPRLAGQHRDYLYRQITQFRGLLRRNEIMHDNTKNVSDEEALALAEYLSSL